MAEILTRIVRGYKKFDEEHADPRTKDWFLVTTPVPIIVIVGYYLFVCTKVGPKFMEKRKPYKLKNTLLVYNFLQVLLSIYIVYEGLAAGWATYYSWICQPIESSITLSNLRMASVAYVYFMTKLTELLDTVLFVLRKRDKQISFLHLYHHAIMPLSCGIGIRYYPIGHFTLFGVINSFVHIIMYSYYFMSALGPQFQKYLWWKKHLTILQLVQFTIVFLHNVFPLFTSCSYPKILHVLMLMFNVFFMILFGNFYIQSYWKKQSSKPVLNGENYSKKNK